MKILHHQLLQKLVVDLNYLRLHQEQKHLLLQHQNMLELQEPHYLQDFLVVVMLAEYFLRLKMEM